MQQLQATKLKILVDSQIRLDRHDIPNALKRLIANKLVLPNPKFVQAEKHGYKTWGIEPILPLYQVTTDHVMLPRGLIVWLLARCKELNIPTQMNDKRLVLPPVDFENFINLRDYQTEAVESLKYYTGGGLVAGCGAGKTETMLDLIAKIQQPTLWVTHSTELLDQTKQRAVARLGLDPAEIGIIAKGKITTGPRLTIALIQTLKKADLDSLGKLFGMIVVDEGHHCAADSYQIIGQFPARYRYWCTATPWRADGLTPMITALAGPVRHTVPAEVLPTIIPRLEVINTEYKGFIDTYNYAGMVTDCIHNNDRNRLIAKTITKECPGHFGLVLSDRIEHLEILHGMLVAEMPGADIRLFTSKSLSAKERKKLMADASTGKVDIILATQLAREGLDLPQLDRLFLALSKKSANAIQQEVGRIMRPCDSKQNAVVFDFSDEYNAVFYSQYIKRCYAYRALGISLGA